ncbi:hypothetical protein Tco_0609476 [Tanacetum coccineum]
MADVNANLIDNLRRENKELLENEIDTALVALEEINQKEDGLKILTKAWCMKGDAEDLGSMALVLLNWGQYWIERSLLYWDRDERCAANGVCVLVRKCSPFLFSCSVRRVLVSKESFFNVIIKCQQFGVVTDWYQSQDSVMSSTSSAVITYTSVTPILETGSIWRLLIQGGSRRDRADYPADGGDDDDEPSNDDDVDTDDEDEEPFEDEDDDEEEEEHLRSWRSLQFVLLLNPVSLIGITEVIPTAPTFETSESLRGLYGIRDVRVDPTEAVEEDSFTLMTVRLYGLGGSRFREAWAHSIGLSSVVHYEMQAYRTHTPKVYEKEAEVVCMYKTLLGSEGFHKVCQPIGVMRFGWKDGLRVSVMFLYASWFSKEHFNVNTNVNNLGFVTDRYQSQVNREPDSVMSSTSSAVTYTSVYTNSEPGRVFWGADEQLSDKGYMADSDPEEDPEEDHADYPADGGDDDDEPSDDDDDDDTDDEDEEPFEDEDETGG